MESLPFPDRAHDLDASLNLLGAVSQLKRYIVHDHHLAQLDSSIRESLRHTSMMEQVIHTINALAEGTEELHQVLGRIMGLSAICVVRESSSRGARDGRNPIVRVLFVSLGLPSRFLETR